MSITQHLVNINGRPVTVTLKFEHWLCRKLGLIGFVYRDTVCFAAMPSEVAGWVVAHELVHVWQWRTHGSWWGHVWRYVQCVRKWGYTDCPYEREAVRHQGTVRTGVLVAIGARSTADYLRHDGRSSVSTTAFTGLQAPFLATWVDPERPQWSRWPSPVSSQVQFPGPRLVAPVQDISGVTPHYVIEDEVDPDPFDWGDPGTDSPRRYTTNDHEDDGA